jgi:hypothetical protein
MFVCKFQQNFGALKRRACMSSSITLAFSTVITRPAQRDDEAHIDGGAINKYGFIDAWCNVLHDLALRRFSVTFRHRPNASHWNYELPKGFENVTERLLTKKYSVGTGRSI